MQELIDRIGIASFIQIVIELWNSVFLIIMIFSLNIKTKLDRKERKWDVDVPYTNELLIFYNAIFLYNIFNVIYIIWDGVPSAAGYWCVRIFNFLYYAAGAFQTWFFLQLIKKHIAVKNGFKSLETAVLIVQLLQIPFLLLLAVTPLTGALYYFDEMNSYIRGPLFLCWHIMSIVSFLFIIIVYIAEIRYTDRFLRQIICTATVIPMLGFLMNTENPELSFNNISVSITAFILYLFYEKHRTDVAVKRSHELDILQTQLAEKKLALEQSKNAVLIAQIQPHFINNSLMALRSRCRDYPEIYESLTKFSKYLRSHFEAIGDTKTITFEKEMENVEAYLDLERENYGDRLQVEYFIECDQFLVPALSVQPLVENAVRHGIGTFEEGGTLFIKAFRHDENICIEIIDDGSGMCSITEQQKKRRGIGIENVRSRLQLSDMGDLEIIRNEHGTTARITIENVQGGTE
ncbi:MAG: histidine kinase [Ruminococcus sp.]|nr:histidine kinase [Ruminococcus sp.]